MSKDVHLLQTGLVLEHLTWPVRMFQQGILCRGGRVGLVGGLPSAFDI
jgi:hypothetical protein